MYLCMFEYLYEHFNWSVCQSSTRFFPTHIAHLRRYYILHNHFWRRLHNHLWRKLHNHLWRKRALNEICTLYSEPVQCFLIFRNPNIITLRLFKFSTCKQYEGPDPSCDLSGFYYAEQWGNSIFCHEWFFF